MRAPDYAEPIVAWRTWDVAERGGELHLCSPLYASTWPLRRELVAVCRPRTEVGVALFRLGRFGHPPPDVYCGCGIYGGYTPGQAVAYLSKFFKRREAIVHSVLGTVSLWGIVVACERGWRATYAYPAHIYVPVPTRRRLFQPGRVRPPALPAEQIALGLADYGVPVELVECDTAGELAQTLDAREGPAGLPVAA